MMTRLEMALTLDLLMVVAIMIIRVYHNRKLHRELAELLAKKSC